MGSRIEWVAESCGLLRAIGTEMERTQPFAGKRIGTGIHLEPKTVALLLTLRQGGAQVIATGNLGTTQAEAVDYLRAHGVTVVGGPTTDPVEHDAFLRQVLAEEPDLLLDNGGDLFVRYLDAPYEHLLGGTEETTSGRMRLEPLRPEIHSVREVRDTADGIETIVLADGRKVHVLTHGFMVNLNGPRPLGNSIGSMDLGFALQARCLEAVAQGHVDNADCVVPVPGRIDRQVAASYLALRDQAPGTTRPA